MKIWCYVDYDTMRVHDLFVTDNNYKRNSKDTEGLTGKYLYINEDKKIELSDSAPEAKYNNEFSEAFLNEDSEDNDVIY